MGNYAVVTWHLQIRPGDEILIELEHGKLGGVEDLVTELSVTLHTEDLKVDITTYRSDSHQIVPVISHKIAPPEEYAQSANLNASLPHSGIPLGKSFFWPALALAISLSSKLPS